MIGLLLISFLIRYFFELVIDIIGIGLLILETGHALHWIGKLVIALACVLAISIRDQSDIAHTVIGIARGGSLLSTSL